MAITSWNPASSNEDQSGAPWQWQTRDNLHTDNTSATTGANSTSEDEGQSIWFGFDFDTGDIEDGSTIDGIEARIRGNDSYGDAGWFLNIYLSDDGGSSWTTATRMPTGSGDFNAGQGAGVNSTHTVGGATDLMGLITPDDADIRSDNFRLRIGWVSTLDGFNEEATLEFMDVRVHYTAGGGGGGRIMSSLVGSGGLVSSGGIAGRGGGLAG